MAKALMTPTTLAEALRLAADLAEKNEELERQLTELRLNREYPEVLRPAHIMKLMGYSKAKVAELTNHPTFPHLNRGRRKGEAVTVLKSDFYEWLKGH
ncbi:hypothetical protein NLX78_07980 [Paenibacillus sp. Lou8.1]|uniref:hypothetical protein n=1 Tax=Paenibacillus sp. Lou8.1 TaxID=2962041 RepID=UPI0020B7DFC8|nr:hypothetical protein [Paenibacillus sp. Lou8.1]MCP3807171.1 hypothetical protein [Paenibacillus sp. Lou8.1]